jgi:hypothetical protein
MKNDDAHPARDSSDELAAQGATGNLASRLKSDEAWQTIVAMVTQHAEAMKSQISEMTRPALEAALAAPAIESIAQRLAAIQSDIGFAFVQFSDAYARMPPKVKRAMEMLADHGWYFDLNALGFSELLDFAAQLESGAGANLDQILAEHFEKRLDEIEVELIVKVPAREAILRCALAAHRRGEFVLSIPVLLAQADGVCMEFTKRQLFQRANKRPHVAVYVDRLDDSDLYKAMLSALAKATPISASADEREAALVSGGLARWHHLNRHMVLHGESLDYGTRLNGLKAVSLINYVVAGLTGRV